MVCCAVSNCRNSSAKISKTKDGITFHRFPRDASRRKQWELAINREEQWSSTASSAVCSHHFVPHDFYLTESGLRKLSAEAVPTINISPCQSLEPTIPDLQPVDIQPHDTEEVVKLKHKVRCLEVLARARKLRINLLWQSHRRMTRKVNHLKAVIEHLIRNKEVNSCS